MARVFNCSLDSNPLRMKTSFSDFNNADINIILDPAHMIKLVMNTFRLKRESLLIVMMKIISFKYIELLLMLQEKE